MIKQRVSKTQSSLARPTIDVKSLLRLESLQIDHDGVGRTWGVGRGLGVTLGVGLGVGLAVGVELGVAVGLGVGVGPPCAQYLPPLLK
jgi:hypothetical protein